METEVPNTDQESGQVDQQQSQNDDVDYKALYFEEVANSKKQRKAKQEAQAKVEEFTKARESDKMAQMKEQEKFQELSEELQKQLDSTIPYKEKWEAHETAQREKHLSKLPKADREKFANENLQVLEYMTEKIELVDNTSKSPTHSPAQSRSVKDIPTDWTKLSADELRENWDSIVDNAISKNNKN